MAQDILIVDDEVDIRELTSGILQDEGYQTRTAAGSADALVAIDSRLPSLVLLDIWLQGSVLDGLGILKVIKRDHPMVPVLMMSGHATIETAVAATKEGAYDVIEKPFNTNRLILLIERAIEAQQLRRENEELRMRAGTEDRLIGNSQAIREVSQVIGRVAPANSRVMITGAAGAGKEVVARSLHSQSHRAAGPFVVLNCATMLPDRVEIELFGTEANSEDGTIAHKIGTFETAHNGTLYLDEVSDMPLETQGKIVRVLQEQIFQRVGGNTRVEVDVRVVASTTRDLAAEIAAGNVREDLFYRLNVVPIHVPALKERRKDIPLLASYFMEKAANMSGQQSRVISSSAIAALQAYDWPGNVRELRNVIERLLIMAPGETDKPIGRKLLPPEIEGKTPAVVTRSVDEDVLNLPLRKAREAFERNYLSAQVTRFGGNVSKTAEFVGMERSALHRKLKTLGVENANN